MAVTGRRLLAVAGVAVAYVVAAKLGLALASVHPSATAVWPPTGIAIAAVLLLGRRALAAVFVGAFVANAMTAGGPLAWTLIATGNTLEAGLAAWAIGRFAGGLRAFERVADVVRFTVIVAVASTASASVGTFAVLVGTSGPVDAAAVWVTWWLGDLTGGVVFAPFLLLWSRPAGPQEHPAQMTVIIAMTVGAGIALATATPLSAAGYSLALLGVPVATWAAFRFGPRGATGVAVTLSAFAIVGTANGHGPFATPDPSMSLVLLQTFLGIANVSALAVAAIATERQQAEAALRVAIEALDANVRTRTAELRSAQNMAHLGSWSWDAKSDLFRPSEELSRIYGLPDTRARPMAAHMAAIHPEERERCAASLAEALRGGTDLDVEFRILRPDGAVRWIHCQGRAAYDTSGAVDRVDGVCQDVSAKHEADRERGEAERAARENTQLREIARIKTQFLNTAAHELATPMTPVRIQVHLLRQAVARGDFTHAERSLDILDRNAQRLGIFVHDLLDAARLQEDHMRLDRTRLDVKEPLTEAAHAFAALAAEKGVQVDVDCPPGLVVDADPKRVSQVLYNLLSNAVKFTPPGGHVHVAGRPENGSVVLSVEDDGRGIRPESIGALFQPFSQLHAPGEAAVPGTGLGLYICRGIVERHGGRIDCWSEGPGLGATFTVAFPRVGALNVPVGEPRPAFGPTTEPSE